MMLNQTLRWLAQHQFETGKVSSYFNYLSFRRFAKASNYQKMLILSAGPSLTKFLATDTAKQLLNDANVLVVAIKQAVDVLEQSPDIFCFNEVRYDSQHNDIEAIRLSVSERSVDRPAHIHLPIWRYRKESSLIWKNNFSRWEYGFSPYRPWGVGIFFELAVHLPALFNIKEVVLAGFDMNKSGRFHFYDNDKDARDYQVDGWEFELVPASTKHLDEYYIRKGIQVEVYTTNAELSFSNMRLL